MGDESDASLIYDRQGHTVVLTMNRPARRNALSLDMLVRMADAWEAIDADDTIRSAILTGAEGAYCTGGDLDAVRPHPLQLVCRFRGRRGAATRESA